jgi:hypothetical protein
MRPIRVLINPVAAGEASTVVETSPREVAVVVRAVEVVATANYRNFMILYTHRH